MERMQLKVAPPKRIKRRHSVALSSAPLLNWLGDFAAIRSQVPKQVGAANATNVDSVSMEPTKSGLHPSSNQLESHIDDDEVINAVTISTNNTSIETEMPPESAQHDANEKGSGEQTTAEDEADHFNDTDPIEDDELAFYDEPVDPFHSKTGDEDENEEFVDCNGFVNDDENAIIIEQGASRQKE